LQAGDTDFHAGEFPQYQNRSSDDGPYYGHSGGENLYRHYADAQQLTLTEAAVAGAIQILNGSCWMSSIIRALSKVTSKPSAPSAFVRITIFAADEMKSFDGPRRTVDSCVKVVTTAEVLIFAK
jgi:hypothetical protein